MTTNDSRRPRRRWPWAVLVIALAGLGLLALTAIGGASTRPAAQVPAGQEVTAFVGDLSASATASGHVEAAREARLSLDIAGTVAKVPVAVGDSVSAGQVLIQLDTAALERSLANAELSLAIQKANLQDLLNAASTTDLASAQATVASAQANLDRVRGGSDPNDIQAARASLAAAQAAYDDLLAGPDSEAMTQAGASLANAEAALRRAQAAYDQVASRADVGMTQQALELEQATNNFVSARAAYDQAVADPSQDQIEQSRASFEQSRAALQKLLDSPTPAELAAAESQLAQAQAQLATVTGGASSEQVAVAQAQVEQARLNLQEARENLEKATLRAPFDGVITALHVAAGEHAAGLAVEIADTAALEVVLDVDEADVGQLAPGQPAVIALETWPGQAIGGTIAAIAPKASAGTSAAVSFDVRVVLGETDLPVRIGMTADADLVTAERTGVLLVPSQAITADREAGTYSANLVRKGPDGTATVTPVQVTIGLRDGDNTEITSGLQAGDRVLVGEITTAAEQRRPGFLPPSPGAAYGGNPFDR